jgi:photosystem I P700 chlorophyll a apoprotein A2
MRPRWWWIAVLGFLCAAALAAQEPSAEQEALKRARVLAISGEVRDIIGITRGVDSALKDLGAKVVGQEIRIELSADVLFDFDKADLRPDAVPALEKVAAVLREYPTAPVLIEGHTDSKGDDQYNQGLSERRAASVKQALAARGASNPITTRGWGETKPAAPNTKPDGSDDPEGRQKNRRVEIIVKKG